MSHSVNVWGQLWDLPHALVLQLTCPWAVWYFEAAWILWSTTEVPDPIAAPVPFVTCGQQGRPPPLIQSLC